MKNALTVCLSSKSARTMELLTTRDLTLNAVVDRVRRAVVVDDEVLARDKALMKTWDWLGIRGYSISMYFT